MEFKYNLELQDYIEFQKYYLFSTTQYKKTVLLVRLLLPVVFAFMFVIKIIPFSLFSIAICGPLSILWFVYYPKIMLKGTISNLKKIIDHEDNYNIICDHTIIVNENGITNITEETKYTIKWHGIVRLGETSSYYFIFDSYVSAIILPKEKLTVNLQELDLILKSKHYNIALDLYPEN